MFSDVTSISILGLKGVSYLDKVANFAQRTESNEAIRISSEVDRIYLNTTEAVEIHDPRLGRKIRIEKQGSNSTVVGTPGSPSRSRCLISGTTNINEWFAWNPETCLQTRSPCRPDALLR
jgi:D-hexose-6-phosphate mutarotase